jgi:hypothetical protein
VARLGRGRERQVIYIESNNFEQAFSTFVQSQEEFDLWFSNACSTFRAWT